MAERSAGVRRLAVLTAVLVGFVAFVLPAFADTPESGLDPNVTLTVTPDDFVGNGQTVVVTGTGFPPNTQGTIRQCGGTAAAPQCDTDVAATFTTTATGAIPPTNVTAVRIIDTGTTTFNCGAQQCALVATAGGVSSRHHISILGAGTILPSSTSSSVVPPSSTVVPSTTSSSMVVTPTTIPPTGGFLTFVCPLLRSLLQSFPFLAGVFQGLLSQLGCPAGG